MIDADDVPTSPDNVAELRARTQALEAQLIEAKEAARARLARAELKMEAIRAGMVDLDGLKLIDQASLKISDDGEVEGVATIMQRLKRSKPWLFGGQNSSSVAAAPPSTPPQPRLATQMTVDEWRTARQELLRRR